MPRISWSKKVWGLTRELVHSDLYSKHELKVKAGGYCSLHYHVGKANRFHVIDATIAVIEMYGPVVKKYMLGPDNVHDVPSLVPHLFCVYKSGTVFEEYYPDRGATVSRDDITRIVEGGLLRVERLDALPFLERVQ